MKRLKDFSPITKDSMRWLSFVTIDTIYDADTIRDVLWHLAGKADLRDQDFRLYGIDADELSLGGSKKTSPAMKERGFDGRDRLIDILGRDYTLIPRTSKAKGRLAHSIEPARIIIETIKNPHFNDTKGKFGRYLAILWTEDGININQLMIDEGLAVENYYDGKVYKQKKQTWFPEKRGPKYTKPRGSKVYRKRGG